jgi:hypothetical protein
MIDIATIRIGDKVYYQPPYLKAKDEFENGILKEIPDHTTSEVRVVFNCADDWKNYKDYTSQLTKCEDLYLGWKHKEINFNK